MRSLGPEPGGKARSDYRFEGQVRARGATVGEKAVVAMAMAMAISKSPGRVEGRGYTVRHSHAVRVGEAQARADEEDVELDAADEEASV